MHDDHLQLRPRAAEEAGRLVGAEPEDWADLFGPLEVRPAPRRATGQRDPARVGVPPPVAASLWLQVFGVGLVGYVIGRHTSVGTAAALLLALSGGVASVAMKVLGRREWARLVVANAAAMYAMAASPWLLLAITRPSATGDALLALLCVYVASAVLLYLRQTSDWFRGAV